MRRSCARSTEAGLLLSLAHQLVSNFFFVDTTFFLICARKFCWWATFGPGCWAYLPSNVLLHLLDNMVPEEQDLSALHASAWYLFFSFTCLTKKKDLWMITLLPHFVNNTLDALLVIYPVCSGYVEHNALVVHITCCPKCIYIQLYSSSNCTHSLPDWLWGKSCTY